VVPRLLSSLYKEGRLFFFFYSRHREKIKKACQIIIQLVVMSLQYIAGGSILCALMPEMFTLTSGMLTSAVVFIGITSIGGMWSASLSNLLNVTLKYIGIILATIVAVTRSGGIENIKAQLPANVPYFSVFDGVGIVGILTWIIVLVTVNLSLQSIISGS